MTIIATAELTDCEYICGPRTQNAQTLAHPDSCLAVAGVVGDSDLTIMRYCVPSLPGAGVRMDDSLVWIAKGTISIMNLVVSVMFSDLARGESLVILRNSADSQLRSVIEHVQLGGPPYILGGTQPLANVDTLTSAIMQGPAGQVYSEVQPKQITGIEIQPGLPHPILYAQVLSVALSGVPDPLGDFLDGANEVATDIRFCVCGLLDSSSGQWSQIPCKAEIWEEADRGHIVWLPTPSTGIYTGRFAVVPGKLCEVN